MIGASKHTRLRKITVIHHKHKYIYCLPTQIHTHVATLDMWAWAVYGTVIMEMRSACKLKSTKHLRICFVSCSLLCLQTEEAEKMDTM